MLNISQLHLIESCVMDGIVMLEKVAEDNVRPPEDRTLSYQDMLNLAIEKTIRERQNSLREILEILYTKVSEMEETEREAEGHIPPKNVEDNK